nr:MAG: hypothetical protein [Bacteriophage sp.]
MTLDIMDGDLWQWDTGREVEAAGCEQVHFAKSTAGTCYTVEVAGNKAKIPDELLQAAGRVYAWAYITDETYGGCTRIEALWDVKRRAKPAEYVYEPSDQRTIRDAETARDEARDAQKAAEAARDRAVAAEVKGARATTLAPGSDATAAMEGNVLVVGVPKGDALRYSDLTAEQVAELKKPATDAAAEIGKTNEEYKAMLTEQAKAFGDAQRARTESYADAERARDKAYAKAETDRDSAYNEAEGKRQAAEGVRSENEGARKSAETGRDTAEKARVKAEAKREQVWTDLKAEAEKSVSDAVERADAANTAATKAIADVKATEAKLYPVAENVLKGTVKDTFVHVDDAFPSSLLGIEIEGACKQDGTPSPDNPVPIQVVENPVFKVTGRNLLDFSFPAYYAAYSSGVAYIKYSYKEVALPFTTEINSANGFGFALKLKPGTYTLRAFNAPAKASAAIAMYAEESKIYSQADKISYVKERVLTDPISFTVPEGAEYVVICLAAEWGDGHNKITYTADFKATVEYGTTAGDYAPHTSQSQSFTLPAEHPYLAKLPDGTADEIVVDKDGNISLIANVWHMTLVEFASSKLMNTDKYESTNDAKGLSGFRINNSEKPSNRRVMCSVLPSEYGSWNKGIISAEWVDGLMLKFSWSEIGITADDSLDARIDKFKAYAANKTDVHIYYALGDDTKKTYTLGKIEMPKAQDSIINVWTDAEVTPRTSIEYTRDVNIVVANLESAIASIS